MEIRKIVWQHGSAMVTIPKPVARRWAKEHIRYVDIEWTGSQVILTPLVGEDVFSAAPAGEGKE